ncbi:MAG: hypothetical protein K2G67_04910 [Muribaculaceae bacterium]|nr:hypothetical protein [Muribaculaceae bacterium]
MNLRKFFILVLLSVAVCASAFSQSVSVKASLDSVNVQMGRMSTIHISVSQPEGYKGHFPLFSKMTENGIIPICGDSVELRYPVAVDSVSSNGRLNIKLDIPVQSFDSGYYQLPPFDYVIAKDTVRSNALVLKVYPVNATADTPIGDFASTADPADPSFFDFLPDWVIDFWWLFIIVILALIALIYGLRKYRKEGSLLPKKPEPLPYDVAINSLRDLKERQLWQQGEEKEYYTQLTDILRKYLYGRFGINAGELTSRQILNRVRANKEIADKLPYFKQILSMADFAKFAKIRPLPEDNIQAYDNALRFVEETKPLPTAEEAESTEKKGGDK